MPYGLGTRPPKGWMRPLRVMSGPGERDEAGLPGLQTRRRPYTALLCYATMLLRGVSWSEGLHGDRLH